MSLSRALRVARNCPLIVADCTSRTISPHARTIAAATAALAATGLALYLLIAAPGVIQSRVNGWGYTYGDGSPLTLSYARAVGWCIVGLESTLVALGGAVLLVLALVGAQRTDDCWMGVLWCVGYALSLVATANVFCQSKESYAPSPFHPASALATNSSHTGGGGSTTPVLIKTGCESWLHALASSTDSLVFAGLVPLFTGPLVGAIAFHIFAGLLQLVAYAATEFGRSTNRVLGVVAPGPAPAGGGGGGGGAYVYRLVPVHDPTARARSRAAGAAAGAVPAVVAAPPDVSDDSPRSSASAVV